MAQRPWGWRLFLGLDWIALVVGPLVALYLSGFPTEGGLVLRFPTLALLAAAALLALARRREWGRWLLLGTATFKSAFDLVILLLLGSRRYLLGWALVYPVARSLLLILVHWLYLTRPAVRRYLAANEA